MTFEELQQTGIEQETRTFSFDCALEYAAHKTFTFFHFKELRQNYLNNAYREVMLKTQFPFEQIVPHIEFVHAVKDKSGTEDVFTGVSLRFSLYILNSPEMTVPNLSLLSSRFLDYFDDFLTHFCKVPMEIKSSSVLLELNRTHLLFDAVNNNKSF